MELKNELDYIKNIVEMKDPNETKEMKEELESIKNITVELVEKQESNAEKVKQFIESYRNRNNVN